MFYFTLRCFIFSINLLKLLLVLVDFSIVPLTLADNTRIFCQQLVAWILDTFVATPVQSFYSLWRFLFNSGSNFICRNINKKYTYLSIFLEKSKAPMSQFVNTKQPLNLPLRPSGDYYLLPAQCSIDRVNLPSTAMTRLTPRGSSSIRRKGTRKRNLFLNKKPVFKIVSQPSPLSLTTSISSSSRFFRSKSICNLYESENKQK